MKQSNNKNFDVIVIGGGPAGMMAAIRASERGRSVLLLEKNAELGKKLSITGGGRCNVTNNKPDVRTMLSSYKDSGKFLFSTFMQFGVKETIDWFKDRGVGFVEENEGRLFPETLSAKTIRDTVAKEVNNVGVEVRKEAVVKGIEHDKKQSLFKVALENGETYTAKSCVVGTGGVSRPETGSTGEGFNWLEGLGHTVKKNDYALVPLAISEKWVSGVSGVTLPECKITIFADEKKVQANKGKMLFTHFGVSGPTILNMSKSIGDLLLESKVTLKIDLFPTKDEGEVRRLFNSTLQKNSNKKVSNVLPDLVPKSLSTIMLEQLEIDADTPAHSLRSEDRKRIVSYVKHLPLTVKGLLGADKAVVSSGGVDLTEINFKTMESRIISGLFLVGDVLDIDRPSGGYSLQLCWSTGYVAGEHA